MVTCRSSLLLIFLAILATCLPHSAWSQLFQITHFAGAASYGSRTINVTQTGAVATIMDPCLGPPQQYHVGFGSPGSYTYTSSAPVYRVRIVAHGLNAGPSGGGEYLSMSINGSAYPITAADMVSYSNCGSTGASPSYLLSGRLYGPLDVALSWSHYNGGIIEVSLCTGINSFSVFCDGVGNGGAYHVFVDTVSACAATVSNNGPVCAGDTIKLFATAPAGSTYSWTGPAGFASAVQNPVIPNATAANAGVYTVVATAGLTTYTVTTTVTVNPTPTVIAMNNGPLCVGDMLALTATASPGAVVSWTGPGGFASALLSPTINPVNITHSGVYTVTATIGSCHDTAQTTVVVANMPTITASNNGPLCAGDVLTLSATGTTGPSILWTGPSGFTSGTANPTISPVGLSHAGTYTVVVSIGSCSDTASTSVVVNPSPTITVTNNGPLCAGDVLTFSALASMGATVAWVGPGGFTSTSANPTIAPATVAHSGVYIAIATLGSCDDTASASVIVSEQPDISAMANSPLCENDTLHLLCNSTVAGLSYSWTGPGGFISVAQNPVMQPVTTGAAGIYTVIASNAGCVDTATATVIVKPKPTLYAQANNKLCVGDTLKLSATPEETGKTFTWIGPLGFYSTEQDPFIANVTAAQSGNYTVTATKNGCRASVVETIHIIPRDRQLRDTTICIDDEEEVTLQINVPGDASIQWSTGQFGHTIHVSDSGTYRVTITYGDCTIIDSARVWGEVCNCKIVLPNAFTPNADGHNDYFRPMLVPEGCHVINYEFAVYNRWGERVFISEDVSGRWDGKYRGKDNDGNIFMYYLKYTAGKGNKNFLLKGDVVLVK